MLHKLMWAYELIGSLFRRKPPLAIVLLSISLANTSSPRSALH